MLYTWVDNSICTYFYVVSLGGKDDWLTGMSLPYICIKSTLLFSQSVKLTLLYILTTKSHSIRALWEVKHSKLSLIEGTLLIIWAKEFLKRYPLEAEL